MSTATHKIDFAEVKRLVSMEQVMAHLGLNGLKPKGSGQWKGACPFCKTADCFAVSNAGGREKSGAFNCFKCPAGGDQIELVSLVRGHGRKDAKGAFAAAKELHDRFLGGIGAAPGENRSESNTSPQPMAEKRRVFDAEAYAKSLDAAHEALVSLAIDPETFRQWKAGYASTGIHRGKLALPVCGRDGVITGFFGRDLKGDSPALTFPNGLDSQAHIFGLEHVKDGSWVLVRDPLDVLRASESGYSNTICFLTEEISATQIESLAVLMKDRQCSGLTFF